jgi:hypothetical protein
VVKIESAASDELYSNILIYADSGAGKTVFAGSDDRVLFVAPEDDGLLSAVRMGTKADKIKIRSWKDLQAADEYLYDNQELLANYDWVVVDSLTEMQSMCLRDLVESQRQARISRDQDPDLPQIQDYQKLYILIEKLVLNFKDLPVNVLFTSLVRNVEDPDGNEFLMPMLGSNKPTDYRIAMKVASHMTSYGYFKVEVVEKAAPTETDPDAKRKVKQRVIYWEDTGAYRGKDRTTRLAPKTVLPPKGALKFIRQLIEGEQPAKVAKAPAKKAAPAKAVAPQQNKEDEKELDLASIEA